MPGVSDNDDAFGINDDRLPEAEFTERCSNGINGVVVDSGVAVVGLDGCNVSQVNLPPAFT